MKWKTGFPEKSGEVLGVSDSGGIYLLHYSAEHRLFNAYDYEDLKTAIDNSIKIVKWIYVDELMSMDNEGDF